MPSAKQIIASSQSAVILSFVWILVRAKVWQTLLRNRASYRDVLFTVGEGYLLNNLLPFRLGELGRAFLISRKSEPSTSSGQRMQFAEVLPTIVIERVVDLGISAAILLAALPLCGRTRKVRSESGSSSAAW